MPDPTRDLPRETLVLPRYAPAESPRLVQAESAWTALRAKVSVVNTLTALLEDLDSTKGAGPHFEQGVRDLLDTYRSLLPPVPSEQIAAYERARAGAEGVWDQMAAAPTAEAREAIRQANLTALVAPGGLALKSAEVAFWHGISEKLERLFENNRELCRIGFDRDTAVRTAFEDYEAEFANHSVGLSEVQAAVRGVHFSATDCRIALDSEIVFRVFGKTAGAGALPGLAPYSFVAANSRGEIRESDDLVTHSRHHLRGVLLLDRTQNIGNHGSLLQMLGEAKTDEERGRVLRKFEAGLRPAWLVDDLRSNFLTAVEWQLRRPPENGAPLIADPTRVCNLRMYGTALGEMLRRGLREELSDACTAAYDAAAVRLERAVQNINEGYAYAAEHGERPLQSFVSLVALLRPTHYARILPCLEKLDR